MITISYFSFGSRNVWLLVTFPINNRSENIPQYLPIFSWNSNILKSNCSMCRDAFYRLVPETYVVNFQKKKKNDRIESLPGY